MYYDLGATGFAQAVTDPFKKPAPAPSGSSWWDKISQAASGAASFGLNALKIKTQAQYAPQQTGPSMTTILLIGGVVIGGIYLLKKKRR